MLLRVVSPTGRGHGLARVSLSFPLAELFAQLDVREAELNPVLDGALFRIPGTREP